jgi:hypothetical protein
VSWLQYVLDISFAVRETTADSCAKKYPAMANDFRSAIATFRKQVPEILSILLNTEQFRSLPSVKLPNELGQNTDVHASLMQEFAASRSREDCARDLAELKALTGDALRNELYELLSRVKELSDARESGAPE